jgi:hypothetical protein
VDKILNEDVVLDISQVALRLKKAKSTVSSEMTRHPENLPSWFKLPGSRRPLWLSSTVTEFLLTAAARAGATPRDKR